VLPRANLETLDRRQADECELVGVSTLAEALDVLIQ
jgi:hypothetical protein